MSWTPIKGGKSSGSPGELPGERGRYLLYLGTPLLPDGPRWVHFSWRGESFCIRDFLKGMERRQEPGLTASDVWRTAQQRKPATGEYFHPVEDVEWWRSALAEL